MRRTDKPEDSVAGQGVARRGFLKCAAVAAAAVLALGAMAPGGTADALAATGKAEKISLKFGFIKLTDMVPLAIAYEQGYFEDEGLSVTLEAQANWKVLLDRVISGESSRGASVTDLIRNQVFRAQVSAPDVRNDAFIPPEGVFGFILAERIRRLSRAHASRAFDLRYAFFHVPVHARDGNSVSRRD